MPKSKPKTARKLATKAPKPVRERLTIPPEVKFLNIFEASHDSGLSVRKLYRHLPEIPGVLRIGGRNLLDREQFHDWLRSFARKAA